MAENPPARKRYKKYGEPDNVGMALPRTTLFRLNRGAIPEAENYDELQDQDNDPLDERPERIIPLNEQDEASNGSHSGEAEEEEVHGSPASNVSSHSFEGREDELSNVDQDEEFDLNPYDSDLSEDPDPLVAGEENEVRPDELIRLHQPQLPLLQTELERGQFGEITQHVVAKKSEVLLNILEYSKRYNLNVTAKEDLHKLVNTLFYTSVIPDTKYKIDKLYSSPSLVKYIFFCSSCFEMLEEVDNNSIKSKVCTNCNSNNDLSDLTKASYFVLFDFVKQFEVFFAQPGVADKLKSPNELIENTDVFTDLYNGEMYKKFVHSLDFSEECSYLSFTACTDGSPLFQSSSALSIWPIFVAINELPPHLRMSNVFLMGLWFGRKHPKMDTFLQAFSNEMCKLSQNNGFQVSVGDHVKYFKAFLISCCVDSGARGSVQCIHCHTGAYSCNWCLHPGEVEGEGSNARKFRVLPVAPLKRTMDEVLEDGRQALLLPGKDQHVNGVLGISPLCRNPKFDIVDGMTVDSLHWACLGIGKQFCKTWLGARKRAFQARAPYYIGSEETKEVLNSRMSKLHPAKEVRRMPRVFTWLKKWNGREWENFILYYSVPVLKNILPNRYLVHWTLFVQAFYLLSQSCISRIEIDVASELLSNFVRQTEELYGFKEMTFNLHISLHAAENVRRWGPLWSLSTFMFENAIGLLKQKVHNERGIPHQIIRSFNEDFALQLLRKDASTPQTNAFKKKMERKEILKCFHVGNVQCMKPGTFEPSREEKALFDRENMPQAEFSECKKIIVDHICYSVTSKTLTDNSVAALKNGDIVIIKKIIVSEMQSKVLLFVSKIRFSPFMKPKVQNRNHQFSPFMYNIDLVHNSLDLIYCDSLKTICVKISINDQYLNGDFISILPYQLNTF